MTDAIEQRAPHYVLVGATLPEQEHYYGTENAASWFAYGLLAAVCVTVISLGFDVWVFAALLALDVVVFGVWLWWVRRPDEVARRESATAARLMYKGFYDEAAERYEALIRRVRDDLIDHPTMVTCRANVFNRQGEPERALGLLALIGARSNEHFFHRSGGWYLACVSTTYAILGDVDRAERFLREALVKLPEARRDAALLPRVLVALRRNNWGEALDVIATDAVADGRPVESPQRHRYRVLRAFAWSQSDSERHARNIQRELSLVRGVPEAKCAYLAVHWPELQAFLDDHELN